MILFHGNPISWKSRLQGPIVRSTTEAEYVAISDASQEILFLARLIEETVNTTGIFPIPTYEDNSACVAQ